MVDRVPDGDRRELGDPVSQSYKAPPMSARLSWLRWDGSSTYQTVTVRG